nr:MULTISPECIES: MFS transporter [unclassified Actinomyces]
MLLVAGALVNALGTGMTSFALGVHVYTTTSSAAAASLVQLCAFAPIVLLAPLAGVLADRHDRRLMMILGDGGSVLGLALVYLAVSAGAGTGAVCAGLLVSSCLASLTEPALRATVTDVVDPENYVRASGLLQLTAAARYLLAPLSAGLLLGRVGITGILLLDASTCLITVALTAVVRTRVGTVASDTDPAGLLTRLAEGWRAVTASTAVRSVIGLMVVVTFAMGSVQALLKPILLPLGPASAVGLCETLAAIGLLAGSAAVAALSATPPARLLTLGLAGAGAAMTLVCLHPSMVWVAAVGALLFAALPLGNAGADAIARSELPNNVQARAWGLISVLTQSGYLIAFALIGLVADHVAEPALADGGALAPTLGALTGTGPGRGCAAVVSLLGLLLLGVAAQTHRWRHRLAPVDQAQFTPSPRTGSPC